MEKKTSQVAEVIKFSLLSQVEWAKCRHNIYITSFPTSSLGTQALEAPASRLYPCKLELAGRHYQAELGNEGKLSYRSPLSSISLM
ncbi:hypothetical protein [Candidatus Venteria ishoeyi]|uniref:hypothetical protein n=1 Tax=Candidatus Venteria ishoeyi TaxID=1899563 RepID=UPI0011B0B748|nr:hypothetical protein [Candidatus Venteria ishoeyi]